MHRLRPAPGGLAHFEVGGSHAEHGAIPVGRGQARPGVRRVTRRMCAPVQIDVRARPDRCCAPAPATRGACDSESPARWLDRFFPRCIRESGGPVIGPMRPALPLGQSQQRGVPAIGPEPRRVMDRQSEIVAQFRPRDALRAGPHDIARTQVPDRSRWAKAVASKAIDKRNRLSSSSAHHGQSMITPIEAFSISSVL